MTKRLRPVSWPIVLTDMRKLCGWVGRPIARTAQSEEHVRRCSVPLNDCRCSALRFRGRSSAGDARSEVARPDSRLDPAEARVAHVYQQ